MGVKNVTDEPTNGRTNQPTDGRTDKAFLGKGWNGLIFHLLVNLCTMPQQQLNHHQVVVKNSLQGKRS